MIFDRFVDDPRHHSDITCKDRGTALFLKDYKIME